MRAPSSCLERDADADAHVPAFREHARVVHRHPVLDAVAVKEGLSVSPEELNRRITEEAARIGEDAGELGKRLRKSDGLQALEIQMVREKALDFLTSSANISSAE